MAPRLYAKSYSKLLVCDASYVVQTVGLQRQFGTWVMVRCPFAQSNIIG